MEASARTKPASFPLEVLLQNVYHPAIKILMLFVQKVNKVYRRVSFPLQTLYLHGLNAILYFSSRLLCLFMIQAHVLGRRL